MRPRFAALAIAAVTFASLGLTTDALSAQSTAEVVRQYREAHAPRIVRDFAKLLAIPNVASDSVGIHGNAEYIRDRLVERGVETELVKVNGTPPIVFGTLRVPGATRTLGVYVHYDGQPVDERRWSNGAWEPRLFSRLMQDGGTAIPFPSDGDEVDPEWMIYARSAGDDKAPIGALLPVLDAMNEAGIQPTSNIIFLFEGEEEAGSVRLGDYLALLKDRLDEIDAWLFFDGPVHQSGRPLLTFGVRGVTGMEITVYGPNRSLHSGHYGNWAPVPGTMLAHLLASMKAETGEVLIDGFYDTVEPLGPDERAALDAIPPYDEELKEELGITWSEGEPEGLNERLLLPSLTIRGLESGNVGERARNVIPSTATATLGIRMVKGNETDAMLDLVEAHIRSQGYHIVYEEPDQDTRLQYRKIARVTRDSGYQAARTEMGLPVVQEIVAATRSAAGEDLVLVPALGGSLPLYLFTEFLDRPAVIVPIANHDDNQHSPDENLRIRNLWYGIDLYAALLTMPRPAME
jgi:acetylornithine deacetylase/succinyl-diaminopimelate desuccinylase-like protein